MPPAFAVLARKSLQPAYALHAQPFAWAPMKKAADVNAPQVADLSRPSGTTVHGAFFDKKAPGESKRVYDLRADQRPGFESNLPRIEFAPPVAGAPPDIRQLDLLTDENGIVWRVEQARVLKTGVLVAEVNVV